LIIGWRLACDKAMSWGYAESAADDFFRNGRQRNSGGETLEWWGDSRRRERRDQRQRLLDEWGQR